MSLFDFIIGKTPTDINAMTPDDRARFRARQAMLASGDDPFQGIAAARQAMAQSAELDKAQAKKQEYENILRSGYQAPTDRYDVSFRTPLPPTPPRADYVTRLDNYDKSVQHNINPADYLPDVRKVTTPGKYDFEPTVQKLIANGYLNEAKDLIGLDPSQVKWLGVKPNKGKDGKSYGLTDRGPMELPYDLEDEPKDVKAPTSRTREEGGLKITEEFDPVTKKWKTVSTAPRELPKPDKPEDPRANLDYEMKLGDKYTKESESFRTIRQARDNVVNSLAQGTAQGDLSAATAIMKMLDPGSVVRESELGMAMNATGAFDRIGNYAQMIQTGKRLNDQQRKDMQKLAASLFTSAEGYHNQTKKRYMDMAAQYRLNPANILGGDAVVASPAPGNTGPRPAPQRPAGFSVSVGGKTYQFKSQKDLDNFKIKAGISNGKRP